MTTRSGSSRVCAHWSPCSPGSRSCASEFTAADVSVGYALLLAQHLGLHEHFTPSVMAYWRRLQARGGFKRAMTAQERAAIAQHVPTTPSPDLGPSEPVIRTP